MADIVDTDNKSYELKLEGPVIKIGDGGSTYTAGNGISGTTISVADPALVNTATVVDIENRSCELKLEGPVIKIGGYTEGTGIDITNNVISVDNTIAKKSEIPTNNNQLANGAGYITGISSSDVTTALGYTPYDSTNPDGYISGIDDSDVITALGYTPTNPSSLATVATSGSFNDLINKPTIPVVNNATLTIKQGGVTKGTFSANASVDEIIELDSGGGGSTYTEGNGIDISGGVISVAAPTLTNTATGENALSVGTAVASGAQSLALGHQARATAAGAIQLGKGTNSTEKTLQVSFNTGTSTGEDYTLLGSDGIIPVDRLATPVTEEGIYILKTFLDWEGNQTTYWDKPAASLPVYFSDTYTGVGEGAPDGEDVPEHTVVIATGQANIGQEATHGVYIGSGIDLFSESPYGIGIGYSAGVGAIGAIQLGNATNSNAGTFQVTLTTDGQTFNNYQVLDANGIIPRARLGNTSSAAFIEGDYVLIANGSDKSWKAAPTVDQTYSATSTNAQSGKAVASAISNKADKATTLAGYGITDGAKTDLSNLTAAGKAVAAHYPMPGGTKVTLTLGASGTKYTASADGWVYCSIESSGITGSSYVSVYNMTKNYGGKSDTYRANNSTKITQRVLLPVSSGDTFAVLYVMGTITSSTLGFIRSNATS